MGRFATSSDLVDLECMLHHETERAVLGSLDGERAGAVWLPRSQVEIRIVKPGFAEIALPERLAIAKGLV